ncbi:MAG: thiamine pyrophosphate-binding protein [Gemmatimonadota bacterium]|nr:thiamine pyrophosphate-binding protein [Gemmatimonadota bacterium]MDH5197760.1 thiamine pyrophosphate-binding protein [Gemmatimonadota bacterium]
MEGEPDRNGGARLAEGVAALGVRTLFTLCGGHISPILVGARRAGLRVVDVRDEAAAVFAADAAARLSGTVGVAVVTAGPGVTNALTALQNAYLAQSPVILIGGAAPAVLRGRGALQDIDQLGVVRPHVKWAARARRVRDLVPLLYEAAARAQADVPGPVFLDCALDLLYDEAIVREWYGAGGGSGRALRARIERWYLRRHVNRMFGTVSASVEVPTPRVTPAPRADQIAKVVEMLTAAERPVLLLGSQAVSRVDRADALAASVGALGVPTFLSGMARGLLGRRHDVLYRHRRRDALRDADLVLLAGVPCDFRLDYGRHIGRGARLVAANLSRREARRNRRPTLTAVGDAGAFVTAVGDGAASDWGRWTAWRAELRARDEARATEIARMAAEPGERVNPIALCRAIEEAAPDDAVFVLDGGDFVATASYVLAPRGPLRHLDPGVFGTLGVGGGFALGAAAARPGAEIWVLYGDGAAAFSLAEFDTFVRHGIPVIAVVGNDASWTQIARDQVTLLGDDVGTVLRRTDYHVVAQGLGANGLLATHTAQVPAILAEARALAGRGRPVLVNALLDRTEFRRGSISM